MPERCWVGADGDLCVFFLVSVTIVWMSGGCGRVWVRHAQTSCHSVDRWAQMEVTIIPPPIAPSPQHRIPIDCDRTKHEKKKKSKNIESTGMLLSKFYGDSWRCRCRVCRRNVSQKYSLRYKKKKTTTPANSNKNGNAPLLERKWQGHVLWKQTAAAASPCVHHMVHHFWWVLWFGVLEDGIARHIRMRRHVGRLSTEAEEGAWRRVRIVSRENLRDVQYSICIAYKAHGYVADSTPTALMLNSKMRNVRMTDNTHNICVCVCVWVTIDSRSLNIALRVTIESRVFDALAIFFIFLFLFSCYADWKCDIHFFRKDNF